MGIFIAKYLENKSNLIFEKEIIEEYLSLPVLITYDGTESDQFYFDRILINQLINKKEKIFFIKTSNISNDSMENCKDCIRRTNENNLLKEDFITVEDNYSDISISDSVFLLINLKTFTYKELEVIKKRLELFATTPAGIILQK